MSAEARQDGQHGGRGRGLDEASLDLVIAAESDGLSAAEAARLRSALAEADAGEVAATLRAMDAARRALRGEQAGVDEVSSELEARLLSQAEGYFAGVQSAGGAGASAGARMRLDPAGRARGSRGGWRTYGGWLAAAAGIALAVVAWWPRMGAGGGGAGGGAGGGEASAWAAVDGRADTERFEFSGNTAAMQGVRGRVVWNEALQRGYMELTNLPVNEPSRTQYQLWIVDPSRSEQPVDGGVFDAPRAGERVAFAPRLAVNRPTVFAITEEKPGGVVVSKGPLLVVAARGKG